jgi:hypothetical protein
VSASNASKPAISFRSKRTWLVIIFILYSLFGWLIVPMILDAQLKSVLKSTAKWDTQIDQIFFNPYALSVELSSAEINEEDNTPVIHFERFYINFNLLKTLTGTLSFDEITLEKPEIHLDLDASGTNFQRAFASESPPEEAPANPEQPTEPLALFFNMIRISEGAVFFTDNSSSTPFKLDLVPLSLSLEAFSTHHNEGGEYSLAISLGNEQALNWQGQIGIAPFQSSGHLELSRIDSATFWHYVKPFSPYWLNQARVSVSGDYTIALQPEGLQVSVSNSQLQLDDVVLQESLDSPQWLGLKQVSIAPVAFDLQKASLDLGYIRISEPDVRISRAADQTVNILRPLQPKPADSLEETRSHDQQDIPAEASASAATESSELNAESSTPFQWKITQLDLEKGRILWHDEAVTTPTDILLDHITLNTGALSQDLSQAFAFDLGFAIKPAGDSTEELPKARIEGELSPMPFTLKGEAQVPDLDLRLAQNYLQDLTNITIDDGRFSIQASYDLAQHDQLSGTLNTSLRVDQLALSDSVLKRPLSGFQYLDIGPLQVILPEPPDTAPSIVIDNITLDQPYADVFITEDGRMNLAQLAKAKTADSDTASPESPEQAAPAADPADAPAINSSLKTFTLNQARFSYSDATLKPVFTTRISELSGSIEGMSSDRNARSTVAMRGKLDALGTIAINGTLNPLSEDPNTHLKILVNNIDLTTASPYSAKYAGYLIDKGKLDLDLDYLIKGTNIKASNDILLNQFEFGKSVDSPEATRLPLPLAIGILKDRKGVIDIDLPISGDLSDPSFKIGSVILNTFVNLITKVVTSPFSILGGLIEGGDKLSEVSFPANSSELDSSQIDSIMQLAKALKERPRLTLEIRATADASIDRSDNKALTEAELINLAKERAQTLSQLIIEQGEIDSQRVFVQEPLVIPASLQSATEAASAQATENAKVQSVTTKFTLGVR